MKISELEDAETLVTREHLDAELSKLELGIFR